MAKYAEEIIAKSIQDLKWSNAQAREREIEKLINYYTGTNTENYIARYFDAEVFQEVPLYKINITKKFIDKKSRVYTLTPNRQLKNKKASKLYNSLTYYKNIKMKNIERMTNLIGTPAVRVYWEEKDYGKQCFNYDIVYYYHAFFSQDPYNPTAIIYRLLSPVQDVSHRNSEQFVYFDDKVQIIYDSDGSIISETEHPYGVLPFVFPRDMTQIDDFYGEGATDVVNVNEHVNIAMTELMLGLRFQMFGQPFATGVYDDKPLSRMGSDMIINLPEGAQFGIESPAGRPESVVEVIKFKLEMLAMSRHMYVTFDSNMDRPSSGLALRIKDFEHQEDYKDDIEHWKLFEQDLYKLEKAIAIINGIELPEDMIMDFKEPEYPRGLGEQITKDNWDLENNLITLEDVIKRDRSDLSTEDAARIIERNKEINESRMGIEEPVEENNNG